MRGSPRSLYLLLVALTLVSFPVLASTHPEPLAVEEPSTTGHTSEVAHVTENLSTNIEPTVIKEHGTTDLTSETTHVAEESHGTTATDPWPMFHHDFQRAGVTSLTTDEEGEGITSLMSYQTKGVVRSSPSMADVTGNGNLEIIIGSFDRKVYCLGSPSSTGGDPHETDTHGTDAHGAELEHAEEDTGDHGGLGLLWEFPTGDWVESSASIGDIDGDHHSEVLIGSYDGYLYCLDYGGELKWDFATGDAVTSSPAVGDLDDDGLMEVVIGSYDGNIYCLDEKGKQKWNLTTGGAVTSSPSIADIDGDGHLDVVIGSHDRTVWVLDGNGTLKWSYTTGGAVTATPVLVNLDQDHELEIVVGANDGILYCIDNDGRLKWSYSTGGAITSSAAVADLDGDHSLDIVFGSYDGNVYCLDEEGDPKWGFNTGGAVTSSPAIGDLDEDHNLEVVVGSLDGNLYSLNSDGSLVWSFPTEGAVTSSPAIVDFNGDGSPNIVFGSDDNNVYVLEIDRDIDGDGLLNSEERHIGTDIHNPDTDGDKILDGDDGYPLDRDNDGIPDAEDFIDSVNNKIIYALVLLLVIAIIITAYLVYRFLSELRLGRVLIEKADVLKDDLLARGATVPADVSMVLDMTSKQPGKFKALVLIGIFIALQAFMGASYLTYMTIQWDSDFCLLGCHMGSKLMAEPYYVWNESVHGNHVAECHDCHHARPTDNMLLMIEVAKMVTGIHKTAHVPDEKCTQCHVELEEMQTKFVTPLVSPSIKKLEGEDFPLVKGPSETGHGVHVTREHIECLECHISGGVHRFEPKENICDKCHYDPIIGPPEEYKESGHGGGH